MAAFLTGRFAEERRALLGGDDAGAVEDAGDLGGEVPAAGEDLGARAVGDHDAFAEQDDARGELGGELDVVGGDDDRGALPGEAIDQADEVVLAAAVHPPGRLVEGDEAGDAVAVEAAGEGDREGEALALAAGEVAGVGVDRVLHADRAQGGEPGLAGELVADPLADQEVARVLGEERHPLGGDPARGGVDQPGGGAQQGALAGAVSTHQGDPLAGGDAEVDAAEHVTRAVAGVELDPEAASLERGRVLPAFSESRKS